MTARTDRNQPPCKINDRIQLIEMGGNDPCPIPSGSTGTVTSLNHFQDAWQISVKWDCPRSLALVYPPDLFCVLPSETSQD